MDFSLLELKNVLGNIKNLGEGGIDSLNFKNISIDSRTCLKNDLFICVVSMHIPRTPSHFFKFPSPRALVF